MKVRVIYNADKTVSVIHPAPKSRRKGETEAQWLGRVFDKATPSRAEYDDIEASELPPARDDRGAWEGVKGVGVYVDTDKAKALRETRKQNALIAAQIKKQQRVDAIAVLKAGGKLSENFTD